MKTEKIKLKNFVSTPKVLRVYLFHHQSVVQQTGLAPVWFGFPLPASEKAVSKLSTRGALVPFTTAVYVPQERLELSHLAIPDPKSGVAANFTIGAFVVVPPRLELGLEA